MEFVFGNEERFEFGEHSEKERIGGRGGGGGGGRHSSRTNLSMAARLKERGKFVTRAVCKRRYHHFANRFHIKFLDVTTLLVSSHSLSLSLSLSLFFIDCAS